MRPDHLSYTRLLKAAVLGAVIGLLCNRQLLIAYDESKLILKFDVVRREADVCQLFDDLMEMISRGTPALKRVESAGSRSDSPSLSER